MVLFLHNTSVAPRDRPLPDEKYPRLVLDLGFTAVPTLCFIDAEGKVVGEPDRSLRSLADTLERTTRLVALRALGEAAPEAERKELFLLELELDLVPAERIRERAGAWSLSDDESALVAQKLVDAEVAAILRERREGVLQRRGDAVRVARAKIHALAKAGAVPSRTMSGPFWQGVLEAASREKDAELAQRAFDALLERYADQNGDWLVLKMVLWEQQLEASRREVERTEGAPDAVEPRRRTGG